MNRKSRIMNFLKRFAWTVAIVLVVSALVLVVAAYCSVNFALNHPNDHFSVDREWARMKDDYPQMAGWMDSIRHTGALHDSTIVNSQGQHIHVYWLSAQQPTHRTVLLVHGYGACAIQMMQLGYMYHHDLGYNIFLYDQYAHGLSDGNVIQMGWFDRFNALQCTQLIEQLPAFRMSDGQPPQTVVHGVSMGAATTMMLSGEKEVPASVVAYVEDCGYTSVWDEFYMQAEDISGLSLPAFPLHVASWVCQQRHGWSFQDASSLQQIRHCQRPMLFIHGSADDYVPTRMVYPLYKAHPGPKALWVAPGSGHAQSYRDHPEEYTRRVRAFLEE